VTDLCVLQNLKEVSQDPWPHIIIKNALPEKIHNELINTLPDERLNQQEPRDHHNKLTWQARDIIAEKQPISSIWQEFMAYHLSRDFFDKVLNVFEPWSKKLKISSDKIKLQDRYSLKDSYQANCYTDFSFVKHPPINDVSNRTPHTDNEKEIYAGLLYLKYPKDESTGGDFCIHKAGSLAMNSHRVYDCPGPIVKSCPYESNNFVMFWNGRDTQHSVSARQNATYPRWSINMIGRFMGTRNWTMPTERKA